MLQQVSRCWKGKSHGRHERHSGYLLTTELLLLNRPLTTVGEERNHSGPGTQK